MAERRNAQGGFDDLSHALQHVRGGEWDSVRIARVRRGMFRKRRRRRARRVAGTSAIVLGLAVVAGYQFWPTASGTGIAAVSPVEIAGPTFRDDGTVVFADGSEVVPTAVGTEVEVRHVGADEVVVGLNRGAARFEITPDRARRFQVRAGEVNVEVLGTVFRVDRTGERVAVDVTRGVVRVEWESGHQLLRRGQGGAFPPQVEEPVQEHAARRARSGNRSWRRLGQSGDYDAAYRALRGAPRGSVRDDPDELWEAADVARRAGHPAEAIPYLERLVERFPTGRRAQNASFTLGRVLSSLGRHGDAADAYRRAQPQGGGLAEAALAREVESLSSAGKSREALQRARRYQQQYPAGRFSGRVEAVLEQ